MLLGVFAVALVFAALLTQRSITELSYRRGDLHREIDDLEKQNTELRARLEKKVNPTALREMADTLGLGAPEGGR